MRKRKKRQATDFLNLLEQAHIQINRDIDSKRLDGAMELLAQCQEGTMELGNMIEGEEGEGCVVIPLLQSYCETVYEIYEQLCQDQHTSGKNAYKHLRKSLLKIENSVKNDIKVRLEIAFFPYKASMWDSMESVWIAADADPGCDPYVVPIPYYERRADRSFGKPYGHECLDYPYNVVAFDKNLVFISPYWGNMFLCLDKDTGEMREWKPPFETSREGKDGYYISGSPGYFVYRPDSLERGIYLFYSQTDSRLYEVNLRDDWYQEIKVSFSLDELKGREPGFREISEWLPYGCQENCFNTLRRFLDGDIMGDAFDRARQLRAYKEVTANCDGTSGEKIHRFLTAKRS